jgi:hypothetical protein
MYGLVNKAIADLVVSAHGEAAWERICDSAGFPDRDFVSLQTYPDRLTYDLVQAASEHLGVPVPELLRAFGRHWMLFTAREGYAGLLDASGLDFEHFLDNLDAMHARLGLAFPELCPPSFYCEHPRPGHVRLHYQSDRAGLTPMILGLLDGLAERFGVQLDVSLEPAGTGGVDHDVFDLHFAPRRVNVPSA